MTARTHGYWLSLLVCLAAAGVRAEAPRERATLKAAGGGDVYALAFAPDGKALASVGWGGRNGPGELRLWDVATGRFTATLGFGHAGEIFSVAFSPDGKTLATGGGRLSNEPGGTPRPGTGELKLWDAATGRNTATLPSGPGVIFSVAFSPDGKALASASQVGTIRLWEVATGKNTATFETGMAGFTCVAFSPDGRKVAMGGGPVMRQDRLGVTGEIQVWDLATGQRAATLHGHPGHGCFSNLFAVAFSVAFSPDGKRLVSGGANTIEVWDVATGKNLATFERPVTIWRVAFRPDGRALAWVSEPLAAPAGAKQAVGREIRLLDLATGRDTVTYRGHPGGAWAVAFSPDGRTFATCGADQTIKLWDMDAPAGR